ncbi:MAG: hypothetical protein HC810_03110 [Acaryochloridaceae cyanobacterium RL_2_7]|nr:hypothetical protein [Acaryochloridaceae cyanobacterium RL_2_7]
MAWFVKIERGIVDKSTFDQFVPAHLQYVKALIEQGACARTGYWKEAPGGMLLFKADSFEQAQAMVEQDPLIQNKCVDYELHEWVMVAGEFPD